MKLFIVLTFCTIVFEAQAQMEPCEATRIILKASMNDFADYKTYANQMLDESRGRRYAVNMSFKWKGGEDFKTRPYVVYDFVTKETYFEQQLPANEPAHLAIMGCLKIEYSTGLKITEPSPGVYRYTIPSINRYFEYSYTSAGEILRFGTVRTVYKSSSNVVPYLVPETIPYYIFVDSASMIPVSADKYLLPDDFHFSENYAVVSPLKADGKYGIINKWGQMIIPAEYDEAMHFSEGLAWVKKDEKWFCMNQNNRAVTDSGYEYVHDFHGGLAVVKRGNKAGYIDKNGKLVIPFIYDIAGDFEGELAPVCLRKKWGYINKTGKVIIPLKYDEMAGSFLTSDGLVSVKLNNKWGCIDKTGKLVIPAIYQHQLTFNNGRALNKVNNLYGLINTKGKQVVAPSFTSAYGFSNGLCAVELNHLWGFIDTSGRFVIPATYNSVGSFYGRTAKVEKNGKYGMIYYDGSTGFNPIYDVLDDRESSGLFRFSKNDKWGYCTIPGRVIIPAKYTAAEMFKDGFARVTYKDAGISRTFYIDSTGREYREK